MIAMKSTSKVFGRFMALGLLGLVQSVLGQSVLYGISGSAGNPSSLHTIDKTTGTGALVGAVTLNGNAVTLNGVCWDCSTGTMYAHTANAGNGINEANRLVTIDLASAVATDVGPDGSATNLGNLACNSLGEVYGISPSNGRYVKYDKTTGAATAFGPSVQLGQAGLTFKQEFPNTMRLVNNGGTQYSTVDTTTGATTFESILPPTFEHTHGDMDPDVKKFTYYASELGGSTIVELDLETATVVRTFASNINDMFILAFAGFSCPKIKKSETCFSSANTVEVQGQGHISMESVKIGDYVRAGKDAFSRVYSFLHLDRNAEADYLQIHADGLKTPLEVSPEHMVFVKSTPVRASQVKVGDMLGDNKVSEIKTVKRRGVYAPVTESGDIVVSGVLASSYAAVRSYTPINQHAEAHAFFAVRRLVCAFNFGICERETYTTDGFPTWLSPMVHFALSTKQSPLLQVAASLVGLPFIAAAYILEQMIYSPLLLAAFFLAFFAFKKKVNKSSKVKV